MHTKEAYPALLPYLLNRLSYAFNQGRGKQLRTSGAFLALAVTVAVSGGCGGGSAATTSSTNKQAAPPPGLIKHVVVIVQENRTPDNLFHGLPNADIANSGLNSRGETVTLTPVNLANSYDLDHSHNAFVEMYDGGKMDGADRVAPACAPSAAGCPPANPQFKYVNPSEVQPYFQLAEQYTFADRMFQTNQGPSVPAHQFILAGTSAPTASSELFAAENPAGPLPATELAYDTGCRGVPGQTVLLIDPQGDESSSMFPCFEHPVLTDRLDAKGITWKYYTPLPGSIWTAPNAINHIRNGADWANVILNQKQVLSDVAAGKLPQVSWVVPTAQASDHARYNTGMGPSWVAAIVNQIGVSQYWSSTAIFITWDDWGGWYDHVAPQIYDSYEYGFRVPLIVVSPFAKTAYVSHVTYDFGSILRFIEEDFNVDSLGYADSRADDLSDCFDFSQAPVSFKFIQAPHDAAYFLHDTSPPEAPDDD
jgi:phospholipase C